MNMIPLSHANIIDLLGLAPLPLDERQEIVESAAELVEMRTMNRVLGALEDVQKLALLSALEEEDSVAVADIFSKNQIDIVAIVEDEVEKGKQELVETKQIEGS